MLAIAGVGVGIEMDTFPTAQPEPEVTDDRSAFVAESCTLNPGAMITDASRCFHVPFECASTHANSLVVWDDLALSGAKKSCDFCAAMTLSELCMVQCNTSFGDESAIHPEDSESESESQGNDYDSETDSGCNRSNNGARGRAGHQVQV
jgi:hypothetical protein